MTRETRIGLLVGLVFIVMFGLVLSELAGPGKSPSAPSASPSDDAYVYNVLPVRAPAEEVASTPIVSNVSSQPVELAAASAEAARVHVSLLQPREENEAIIRSAQVEQVPQVDPGDPPAITPPAGSSDVVAQGNVYIVKPGDNLIKIAREVYGTGKENEYKRILSANSDSVPDEKALKVGEKLTIPVLVVEKAPAKPAGAAIAKAPPVEVAKTPGAILAKDKAAVAPILKSVEQKPTAVPDKSNNQGTVRVVNVKDLADEFSKTSVAGRSTTTMPAAVADAAGRAGKTYVVQPGDSRAKIARLKLKDDSKASINQILALNKDQISSPERLKVGTSLVLPG